MSDAASPGATPGAFSPFERLLALRYLRARRRRRAPSFTAVISVIGIAVGVAILIIVMSAMNGMRHEVLSQILGIDPHVRIENPDGLLKDYDALAQRVREVSGVLHAMPVIDADVMAVAQGRSLAATARGEKLSDLLKYSGIGGYLIAGSLDASADEIVMADRMARSLGVGPGSEVTLVTPNPEGAASESVPRSRAFRVAALFAVENDKYAGLLYMPLETAQRYFGMTGAVTSIDVDGRRSGGRRDRQGRYPAGARRELPRARLAGPQRGVRLVAASGAHRDLHPAGADHAGGRLQHRVGAGDAGEGQGPRDRHPPHHGRHAPLDPAHLLHERRRHRRVRHHPRA